MSTFIAILLNFIIIMIKPCFYKNLTEPGFVAPSPLENYLKIFYLCMYEIHIF